MSHGTDPTKVLLQWRTMRLRVKPKIKELRTFLLDIDREYICEAIATGASHHFPTGSKAAEKRTPDKADSRSATNPMH